MKKNLMIIGLSSIGMLLCAMTALGQEKAPEPVTVKVTRAQGEKTAPVPVTPNTFTFVNSEFIFDGNPVKGAPYSAQAVTETTQTLSDGNRIVNKSTATVYRDGEGRTRREQTLKSIGGMTASAPLQTIMINDPVAGVNYTLDPGSHTARKNSSFAFERAPLPAAKADDAIGGVVVTRGNMTYSTNATPPEKTSPAISVWTSAGPGGQVYRSSSEPQRNVNVEKLGTQIIEGVEAMGTRTTITIPAGEIGNERPIEIVDERWYSNDLHTIVMSRHSDPRSGESVYRLTNIDRNEPAPSLFEIPGDYQLKEGPTAPAQMRLRKPEN